jgi:hypothetical protein
MKWFCFHKWKIIKEAMIKRTWRVSGKTEEIGMFYIQECIKCGKLRKVEIK